MQISWNIAPVSADRNAHIQHILDTKTKPVGSLGMLEQLAFQMAAIQGQDTITINRPACLVFAADHGVSDENISLTNSDVTRLMVLNFLAGGSAINCFCNTSQMALQVIDAGMKTHVQHPDLLLQRVADGTRNFAQTAAMDADQAWQALALGRTLAHRYADEGSTVLAFGEMGIGNTTSAAAIMSALLHLPASQCVGRGTGITDAQLQRKQDIVTTAVARLQGSVDPLAILQEVGGFEIAQITGAMLGAAERGIIILVDGFIITAAALLATRLVPPCRDYMLFAHCSGEQGHKTMLETLQATPLLHLGLRLGEGTGAAVALPLLRAAAEFFNHMASFESAGVTL